MKKKGLLCLLTAGIMMLSACSGKTDDVSAASNFNDQVVMKVDGKEIMKSEYMVYLYTTTKSFTTVGGYEIWTMDFDGQTADELVQERTLNTLQSVIAATNYANENNITLSEEQKAGAVSASEQFVANVPEEELKKMGIDAEKLTPFMEGSYLYSIVYQALAAESEVDAAEQAKYFAENKAQMHEDYTKLDLDTVVLDDLNKAKEVVKRANDGEDFKKLFQEYDVDENAKKEAQGGNMSVYKAQFVSSFGLEEIPAVGKISEPIEMDGVYFVIRVNSVTPPEDSEIETMAQQAYTNKKQAEYSDARFAEMIAAQKVEFVDDVYNNLEKFH